MIYHEGRGYRVFLPVLFCSPTMELGIDIDPPRPSRSAINQLVAEEVGH
jgi:hypothetical protein